MEITVPISSNIALRIENRSKGGRDYPSSRLQKGFVLEYDGQELVDEAVGFGVPVLKLGHNTIFAGDLDLSSQHYGRNQIITALYHMNLEERINRPKTGSIENKQLYTIKNSLAWLIRTYPLLRGLLTAVSNGLRHMFKWQTVYEQVKSYGEVKVTYSVDTAVRKVFMIFDMIGLQTNGIAEVAVMNEQGAHYFTHYQDSEGA